MSATTAFLLLQGFIVLFLLLHDWIPLGRLNNVENLHNTVSWKVNLLATIGNTVPAATAFILTLRYELPYPVWLKVGLVALYAILFAGELVAWWIPWLFGTMNAERTAQYVAMFGDTHAFLPKRHQIVPNTAHTVLHTCTLGALVLASYLALR